jgi:hypothetical protein
MIGRSGFTQGKASCRLVAIDGRGPTLMTFDCGDSRDSYWMAVRPDGRLEMTWTNEEAE